MSAPGNRVRAPAGDHLSAPAMQIRLGPVRRGRVQVLEGWEGEIPTPAVCGLVGLNGAGKSSLMLALAGALRLRSASAEVLRRTPEDGVRPATLALAPQQAALPPWLGLEGVCALHGLDAGALMARYPGLLLEELAGRPAEAWSGGQAQALSVALALAAGAELTMLDEPLAALDVRRRRGLLDLLAARRYGGPDGGAVLLSSQSAADLHEACDHLLVIAGGRVVYHGPTDALMGSAAGNGAGPGLEARLLALAGGPLEPPAVGE